MQAIWFFDGSKPPLLTQRLPFARHAAVLAGLAGAAAMGLGGCSQHSSMDRTAHSKEYFPSSIYGKASPRVVADGEPVPRGGGTYLVGKPYTIAGQTYYPSEKPYSRVGLASWYGDAFHGRRTANGEVYDRDAISAAHPTLPLPSYARITNLHNNHSLVVRVNDRGPFHAGRILDVSRRTAEVLDFHKSGTAKVKVEYIGKASLDGSDDSKLLATLRVNKPAVLARDDEEPTQTRVANVAELPVRAENKRVNDADPSLGRSGRLTVADVPLPPARPFGVAAEPGASTRMARINAR
jgi:rare lipoprotein A